MRIVTSTKSAAMLPPLPQNNTLSKSSFKRPAMAENSSNLKVSDPSLANLAENRLFNMRRSQQDQRNQSRVISQEMSHRYQKALQRDIKSPNRSRVPSPIQTVLNANIQLVDKNKLEKSINQPLISNQMVMRQIENKSLISVQATKNCMVDFSLFYE